MKKGWSMIITIIIILVILLALIAAYIIIKNDRSSAIKECSVDSDCIPASCCHPTECTSKENVNVCNILCTQECVPNTLDCGQGSCKCVNNKCGAEIK